MDLTRFQRILRSRWLVLALVAVISIWLANELTAFRNDRRPTREAVAAISFFKQLGELDDEAVKTRIEDAAVEAADVNLEDLKARLHPLAPWEIAEVQADPQDLQLLFIGRADTDQEAITIATRIRDRYMEDEPFTELAEIDEQLHLVALKLADLQGQISAATPDPAPTTETDIVQERNQAALQAQVESMREDYNENAVSLLNTDLEPDDIDAILADQERLLTLLQQYELTLLSLQPEEVEEPLTEEGLQSDLQLQLWETEFNQLLTTYQGLFQQKVDFENLNRVETVEVFPSSLEPISPINNQALALVAGLLVGAVGLLLADRLRQPLWSARDIEGMAALPEVPPRGWLEPPDKAWYLGTRAGQRKAGIQVLRATIENLPAEQGKTIGLTGIQVYAEDVQELAADLAVAVAISGKKVLLVNADFTHQSHLYEIEPGMVTLASLIEATPERGPDPDHTRRAIANALLGRPETVPGMRALPAGQSAADATDMLSRPAFTSILDVAADTFDVILVSGADANDPITHVLSQRLDAMLLVGSAGHTTTTGLDVVKREFSGRRAAIVGMTLLRRRPTRLRRLLVRLLRRDHRGAAEADRAAARAERTAVRADKAAARAARRKAAREARQKAAAERAARAAKERAVREKAAQEKAAREKAAKEKAAKEKAAQAAREKAAKEKAAQEKAAQAAREKAAKEKAAQAAREKAAKEKAAQEKAAKEAAAKAAEHRVPGDTKREGGPEHARAADRAQRAKATQRASAQSPSAGAGADKSGEAATPAEGSSAAPPPDAGTDTA